MQQFLSVADLSRKLQKVYGVIESIHLIRLIPAEQQKVAPQLHSYSCPNSYR